MRCRHCASVVPPGMHFCGMCGRSLASSGPGSERERRRVSVVFVDLMGFSTLTHGLDPEVLRDLADEVLTVVAGVVDDYDGYVDAFRGDGLIAVFGAPHSHADDPFRAVVAAAAALRAIEAIGTNRGLDLRGRAGVTTGMVVAGSVGSGRVREYTVMGSVVNLASRLETAARAGQVLVGRDTYEATRHRLSYTRVDGPAPRRLPDGHQRLRLRRPTANDSTTRTSGCRSSAAKPSSPRSAPRSTACATARPGRAAVAGGRGRGGQDPSRAGVRESLRSRRHLRVVAQHDPQRRSRQRRAGLGFAGRAGPRRACQRRRAHALAAGTRKALQRLLPDDARWQRLVLGTIGLVPPPTWTRLGTPCGRPGRCSPGATCSSPYARERPGNGPC
jgi:class 3 adenylate cyclase